MRESIGSGSPSRPGTCPGPQVRKKVRHGCEIQIWNCPHIFYDVKSCFQNTSRIFFSHLFFFLFMIWFFAFFYFRCLITLFVFLYHSFVTMLSAHRGVEIYFNCYYFLPFIFPVQEREAQLVS